MRETRRTDGTTRQRRAVDALRLTRGTHRHPTTPTRGPGTGPTPHGSGTLLRRRQAAAGAPENFSLKDRNALLHLQPRRAGVVLGFPGQQASARVRGRLALAPGRESVTRAWGQLCQLKPSPAGTWRLAGCVRTLRSVRPLLSLKLTRLSLKFPVPGNLH